MTLLSLKVWIKTKHSEQELRKALHLIDKHQDALEDALNLRGKHTKKRPRWEERGSPA